MNSNIAAKLIAVVIVIIIVLTFFSSTYTVVPPGNVGVKVRLGNVSPEPLQSGLQFKMPYIEEINLLSTKLLSLTAKTTEAASKDLQTVTCDVSVQFALNADSAPKVYQRIGTLEAVDNVVLQPAIQETVKAVTARYTAEELISKRNLVKQDIQDSLQQFINHSLQEKQLDGALSIANVAITQFDFSQDFNQAIEQKVKAEQDALKAVNDKTRRVTEAEAAASEKRIAADAFAYQTKTEAAARADAIDLEGKAITANPQVIQLRSIEKWDGTLPRVVAGEKGLPIFMSLDSSDDAKKTK